jgi:hypothetical protein
VSATHDITVPAVKGISSKAQRLILEGRVHPVMVDPTRCAIAVVDGDSGTYLVTVVNGIAMPTLPHGGVAVRGTCSCEAFTKGTRCSHIVATEMLLEASEPNENTTERVLALVA